MFLRMAEKDNKADEANTKKEKDDEGGDSDAYEIEEEDKGYGAPNASHMAKS